MNTLSWRLPFGGVGLTTFLASLFIIADLIGGFRAYSPVPFSDMWDGYLAFYDQLQKGHWRVWFAFHNEHRILLARILFWLDLDLFGGQLIFLNVMNYFLLGCIALVFYRYLSWCLDLHWVKRRFLRLAAVMTFFLFSWAQDDNLVWAFQSQFFMAQLLPISAFFLLDKAFVAEENKGQRLYLMAIGVGVLSPLTMANGVLALPLMALQAWLFRGVCARFFHLLLSSMLVWFAYFHGYATPSGHSGVLDALNTDPSLLVLNVFSYLGGPLYRYSGEHPWSIILARVGGAITIILLWIAIRQRYPFREGAKLTRDTGLIIFGIYICGTALATAAGRMKLGVDPALVSRYTTPTLMFWSSLVILHRDSFSMLWERKDFSRFLIRAVALSLLMGMIHVQLKALRSHAEALFNRRVSIIALALGVEDRLQMEYLRGPVDRIMRIANIASQNHWSIFGREALRDLSERMGSHPVAVEARSLAEPCFISLHRDELFTGKVDYWLVSGHLEGRPEEKDWVYLLDGRNVPMGVVSLMKEKKGSGWQFRGYQRANAQADAQTLFYPDTATGCTLRQTQPG